MNTTSRIVARSFREALQLNSHKVTILDLTKSKDLLCVNMMCSEIGGPCACRLARFMEQSKWDSLEQLILAKNDLVQIPTAALVPSLKTLDISDNKISKLSSDHFEKLPNLETLICAGNPLDVETFEIAIAKLPRLRKLVMANNSNLTADQAQNLAIAKPHKLDVETR